MKFERLYKLLLEASSFSDLPDNPPYGFWIHPNGDFTVVTMMNHDEAAMKIVNSNPTLKAIWIDKTSGMTSIFMKEQEAYFVILRHNYNRVVISNGTLFYAKPVPKDNRVPTNSQLRTAKDLAAFYNLKVEAA